MRNREANYDSFQVGFKAMTTLTSQISNSPLVTDFWGAAYSPYVWKLATDSCWRCHKYLVEVLLFSNRLHFRDGCALRTLHTSSATYVAANNAIASTMNQATTEGQSPGNGGSYSERITKQYETSVAPRPQGNPQHGGQDYFSVLSRTEVGSQTILPP